MSVDWSQFRDGDLIRVTCVYDGWWDAESGRVHSEPSGRVCSDIMKHATSAEIIDRPFTPPVAGRIFRVPGTAELYVSFGGDGYRRIRNFDGRPRFDTATCKWSGASFKFRRDIQVVPE